MIIEKIESYGKDVLFFLTLTWKVLLYKYEN